MLDKNTCNYLDTARFIGIYLVIFAHITLIYQYNFISYMVYCFHMPLFFIISGILHKQQSVSRKNLWKIIYSLLIPFLLYNAVCYIYLLIAKKTLTPFSAQDLFFILTGQNMISGASWFILVLFWIKLVALFTKTKKAYIVTSVVFLGLIFFIKHFYPGLKNYYLFQSTLLSFPFFTIGYLIKDKLDVKISKLIKIIFITVGVVLLYLTVTYSASISIAEVAYGNLFINIVIAVIGSAAIIFFSQLVTPYIKCSFIKDISRGTMLIVGLHFFIMFQVLSNIFFGPKSLRVAVFLSIAMFLGFYVIIKLTYDTIPILYGKKKKVFDI